MSKTNSILSGTLVYKDSVFQFVFDNKELRLIIPDEQKEQYCEWKEIAYAEGLYSLQKADPIFMENSYLIGESYEDFKKYIFITRKGAPIKIINKILIIEVLAYIGCKGSITEFNSISISSPEINSIYPLGSTFFYDIQNREKKDGVWTVKTLDFDSIVTSPEIFEYNGKKVSITFGSRRRIDYDVNKNPISIDSIMNFKFEKTDDYRFIYEIWRIAKQFIQYLCYRKDIHFKEVALKSIDAVDLYLKLTRV